LDTNSLYFKPTQDYWYSFVGLNYKLGTDNPVTLQ